MYELIILGMLMKSNAHGFLLAKIINDIIGPVAKASNGRIYPLLNKLTEDGMTEVVEETVSEGGLPMRIYGITDKGRTRFHALMLDTASNVRAYREIFGVKVSFFNFLSVENRVYLIKHYMSFCKAHLNHLKKLIDDRRARHGLGATGTDIIIDGQEHVKQCWALELSWVNRLLNKVLQNDTDSKQSDPSATFAALITAVQCSTYISEVDKERHAATLSELQRLTGNPKLVQPIFEGTLSVLRKSLGDIPDIREKYLEVCKLIL